MKTYTSLLLLTTFLQAPAQATECGSGDFKYKFQDCGQFANASFMGRQMKNTSLRDFSFETGEIKALHTENVDMSGLKIKGARISDSQFAKTNFSNAVFVGVRFDSVDFTESDLTNAIFIRCFFRDVKFKDSNTNAKQFIDPIWVPK